MFFKVFANAGFWVFEALNGPLGLILAPSWADLVPKWSPELLFSGEWSGSTGDAVLEKVDDVVVNDGR